jgi:hypothetical protein
MKLKLSSEGLADDAASILIHADEIVQRVFWATSFRQDLHNRPESIDKPQVQPYYRKRVGSATIKVFPANR